MHRYEAVSTEGEVAETPPIDSVCFTDARQVVARAQVDTCIGWMTWPEVWHLDGEGRFCCYFKGSSLDSLRGWADDPSPLRRSRLEGLRGGGCADHWVVVDSRPSWRYPAMRVGEPDVEALIQVRQALEPLGVGLLDVVIFDDRQHWWSLHELSSGTTRWEFGGRS
ncbi:MAG: hypothetical protein ACRD2C_18575 [Acidimicrobiales bacterium]